MAELALHCGRRVEFHVASAKRIESPIFSNSNDLVSGLLGIQAISLIVINGKVINESWQV